MSAACRPATVHRNTATEPDPAPYVPPPSALIVIHPPIILWPPKHPSRRPAQPPGEADQVQLLALRLLASVRGAGAANVQAEPSS